MRRDFWFSIILSIIFCASSYGGTYGGGSGTPENPYLISESAHLVEFSITDADWTQEFRMTADIDMAGISISPIRLFTGVFDGAGQTIHNLTQDSTTSYGGGLFLAIGTDLYSGNIPGVVKNLHLENIHVLEGLSAGGIASILTTGEIFNCSSAGSVHGEYDVGYTVRAGGIVGSVSSFGSVRQCWSSCSVSATYVQGIQNAYVGGLVGRNYGSISDCYSTGSVTGEYAGGFVGSLYTPLHSDIAAISNCYSSGHVDQSSLYPGGFAGNYESGTFTNCFWNADTSGTTDGVGNVEPDPAGITGLDDPNMMIQSNFTGWDFLGEDTNGENEIWRMCIDGVEYPRLSWEFAQNGDFACGDGVDILDLQALAEAWLLVEIDDPTMFNYACNANGDGVIDLGDFGVLGANW